MLDKDVFREQMERLNVLFPNWKVDITDSKVMKTWYNEFKGLSEKKFVNKVDKFIQNSSYPPTVATILDQDKAKEQFDHYTIAN